MHIGAPDAPTSKRTHLHSLHTATECAAGTGWDKKSKKCLACTGNTASPGGPSPATVCTNCAANTLPDSGHTACMAGCPM